MKSKNEYQGLLDAARNLLKNRVDITAAQSLVLKSLLDKLQQEVNKFNDKI